MRRRNLPPLPDSGRGTDFRAPGIRKVAADLMYVIDEEHRCPFCGVNLPRGLVKHVRYCAAK